MFALLFGIWKHYAIVAFGLWRRRGSMWKIASRKRSAPWLWAPGILALGDSGRLGIAWPTSSWSLAIRRPVARYNIKSLVHQSLCALRFIYLHRNADIRRVELHPNWSWIFPDLELDFIWPGFSTSAHLNFVRLEPTLCLTASGLSYALSVDLTSYYD